MAYRLVYQIATPELLNSLGRVMHGTYDYYDRDLYATNDQVLAVVRPLIEELKRKAKTEERQLYATLWKTDGFQGEIVENHSPAGSYVERNREVCEVDDGGWTGL